MIIKGLDAGLASGIVYWDTGTQRIVRWEQAANGVEGVAQEFDSEFHYDVLVAESFTLRAGNKFLADLSTVEVNGWLKGQYLWDKSVAPNVHKAFCRLGAKDPKANSPITKLLKEQGVPIGAGHVRDALSIAIWYSCTKLKDPATLALYARLTKEK